VVVHTIVFGDTAQPLMNRKCVGFVTVSLLVLSTSQAQDAKIVADNLEYSREFYSGVHFSTIASLPQSFAYDRYPGRNAFDAMRARLRVGMESLG
jgi:hypothetical protein